MTTIKYYVNKKNPNKYLEVHNDGYYHNSVRQFLTVYRRPSRTTKNYTGDGCLHRWRKNNLRELLSDYKEVDSYNVL